MKSTLFYADFVPALNGPVMIDAEILKKS